MKAIRPSHALAIFLSALVVRLAWMPSWGRLVFEGHEAFYRDAFLGQSVRASTQAYPLLTGLYGMLGQLTQDERALVVFSSIVGAAGVVGAALWVSHKISPVAGLWTGVLVSVLPEHVAWSTSAYNVVLPLTLFVWALALRGRWAFIFCALAVSLRAELVLLAPLIGFRGLLGGVAGFSVLSFMGVGFPQVRPDALAFDINWPMMEYLGPSVLLVAVLSLRDPRTWRFLLVIIWVHAVGSAFDDYGARHALLGGIALCGLVGTVRRVWVPLAVAVALSFSTFELSQIWHASDDGAIAVEAQGLSAPPPDCIEVTEEPYVPGQALPSHVRYFRGDVTADCVLWGEEFWHRSWSSRGLRDRAQRMRTLYKMEAVGALQPVNGGPVRLYHRLEKRW